MTAGDVLGGGGGKEGKLNSPAPELIKRRERQKGKWSTSVLIAKLLYNEKWIKIDKWWLQGRELNRKMK